MIEASISLDTTTSTTNNNDNDDNNNDKYNNDYYCYQKPCLALNFKVILNIHQCISVFL